MALPYNVQSQLAWERNLNNNPALMIGSARKGKKFYDEQLRVASKLKFYRHICTNKNVIYKYSICVCGLRASWACIGHGVLSLILLQPFVHT